MKAIYSFIISMLFMGSVLAQSSTKILTISNISTNDIDNYGYHVMQQDVQSSKAFAVVKNDRWIPATIQEGFIMPTMISQKIGYSRKKPILQLSVPAYRMIAGQIERLVSYDVEIKDEAERPTLARPTYPANSVLSTGQWYKIGVTQRGIHKIDAAFLTSIGIDVAALDARNIRIYGNGGQTMTEIPDDSEPNDLVENAIFVSSSGSSFGASDYVLFYYDGLKKWQYNASNGTFEHINNYYSDTGYFFINVDKGPGKRIETVTTTGTPSYTFDVFNNYTVIDEDSAHFSTQGKIWWSHRMYTQIPTSLTQHIYLKLPHLIDSFRLDYHVGSTAQGSRLFMSVNDVSIDTFTIRPVFDQYQRIDESYDTRTLVSGADIKFTIRLQPSTNPGVGFVNYIRANGISRLDFSGLRQLNFRNVNTLSSTGVTAFEMKNANANTIVWDVTDKLHPKRISTNLTSSTLTGKFEGGYLNEFIAFDGSQYHTPAFSKVIENQNLHSLGYADLIIITPAIFKPIAESFRDLHAEKDGITTHIVDVEQIYNEFSSGAQDIAGIRNFLRMFYDRATAPGQVPKNVMMLGLASYDYKNRLDGNTNFIPTFQTWHTSNLSYAYSTDDYFVLLDSAEYLESSSSYFDMGIGRLPIKNLEEGYAILNKIKYYLSPEAFGPWKNVMTIVADDADGAGHHARDGEVISSPLAILNPAYNYSKMYADAYPMVSSAAGKLVPKLTSDLNNQISLGSFIVNYSGHGSPLRLADENILTIPDIQSWRNFEKLPVIITGTCDFGRYDNPSVQSGGALMILKPDGGSVASITTTQLVYSGMTTNLLRNYIDNQFTRDIDDEMISMGEAMMRAKNHTSGAIVNSIKYALLGDPALKLPVPNFNIQTDSLKIEISENEYELNDTLSALGNYELYGSIRSRDGGIIHDFNGKVFVTIYDKPQEVHFPEGSRTDEMRSFKTQNNIMFRGQATVSNGQFKIHVLIPKDINYNLGKGKISYYAQASLVDAAGADTSKYAGGFASFVREDNSPPLVMPFIDDNKFEDGGVTGPDPLLYVELEDDNGINVSGSSIGHDLIAVLDNDWSNPFILNNYYFTDSLNNNKGYLYYQLSGLSEGWHEITVRAWDVYNNPGMGTVKFKVVKKDKAEISSVHNYPNPIIDGYTNFVIQHNLSNMALDVTIQLYDPSGKQIFTIERPIPFGANRLEIPWNGHDEHGLGLPPGVYHYRCTIKHSGKIEATAYNKLVLIR